MTNNEWVIFQCLVYVGVWFAVIGVYDVLRWVRRSQRQQDGKERQQALDRIAGIERELLNPPKRT